MKKFIKITICIALCLLTALTVIGCDDSSNANGTTGLLIKKSGDVYYVKSYSAEKNVKELTVGETDGYTTSTGAKATVTKIGDYAFKNNATLETVIVKDNVTEIGKGAFAGMTSLKKLVLPFAGQKVGAVNDARLVASLFGTTEFDGSLAVTAKADDGATEVTYYIPATLNEIVIDYKGADAYSIPQNAFANLPVSKITVTGNVDKIGQGAFSGTLITEFNMPETVTEIGASAFASCKRLTSVTFGANASDIETIGEKAFYSFKGTEINLPKVKTIGEFAFASESDENLSNLQKVTAVSVDTIEGYAFYNLGDLEINFTATTVASTAFNKTTITQI